MTATEQETPKHIRTADCGNCHEPVAADEMMADNRREDSATPGIVWRFVWYHIATRLTKCQGTAEPRWAAVWGLGSHPTQAEITAWQESQKKS